VSPRIELLAPAGNKEIFKAAVDSGADAVYCGINLFNARLNAVNLTMDDIYECTCYAHERSSLVYLTLNTLLDDMELPEAVNTAVEAYNNGVDAILVQDMGLLKVLHDNYPELPVHASTQMNAFSREDIRNLKELGVKRVVLPRELTLSEIRDRSSYCRKLGMETEVFIQGAVCICVSGLCLFSSMNKSGSRSGNRGLCAQPCRREYDLYGAKGIENIRHGHLLSPKDRSAAYYLEDLINAGVTSFKIEGRMRDEAYVRNTVATYRKLMDSALDGGISDELMEDSIRRLSVSFNRGGSFTPQSLAGRKDPDILSGEYVGKYGVKLGKVTLRDVKNGTITIRPVNDAITPQKGDYISIREGESEIRSFPVGKVDEFKGNIVIKGLHPDAIKELPVNVTAFLMSHDYKDDYKRKTHITITFDGSYPGVIKAGAVVAEGPFEGVFAEDELSYDVDSSKSCISEDRIKASLNKTGSTPFACDEIYIFGSENVNCSVSLINELRRGVLELLSSEIISASSHSVSESFLVEDYEKTEIKQGTVKTLIYCPSAENVSDIGDSDILAFSFYDYLDGALNEIKEETDKEILLVKPDFYHDSVSGKFSSVKDFEFMPTAGTNVYNEKSLEYELKKTGSVFMSYEVSPNRALTMLKKCNSRGKIYLHAAGPVPWMQTDFCPVGQNKDKCRRCIGNGAYILKQIDNGPDLKVVTHPLDCSATIWGPGKYLFDEDTAREISSLGYDVIMCYTEV